MPRVSINGVRLHYLTGGDGPHSVVFVSGAGHTPMLERPDLFYPLFLNFLGA